MRRASHVDRGLPLAVALLATINLLNNRLLPRAYAVTGVVGSGVLLRVARGAGHSWAELGLGRGRVATGLRWGFGAVAVVSSVYTVAWTVPATRVAFLDQRITDASRRAIAAQALVRVPLGTVLLEEVAFRGVLDAMLWRRYGRHVAIAMSSLLFGLWHVLPARGVRASNTVVRGIGPEGPSGDLLSMAVVVATAAAGGAVFSELRRRSRSLLSPSAAHWALNGLGYVFAARALREQSGFHDHGRSWELRPDDLP